MDHFFFKEKKRKKRRKNPLKAQKILRCDDTLLRLIQGRNMVMNDSKLIFLQMELGGLEISIQIHCNITIVTQYYS